MDSPKLALSWPEHRVIHIPRPDHVLPHCVEAARRREEIKVFNMFVYKPLFVSSIRITYWIINIVIYTLSIYSRSCKGESSSCTGVPHIKLVNKVNTCTPLYWVVIFSSTYLQYKKCRFSFLWKNMFLPNQTKVFFLDNLQVFCGILKLSYQPNCVVHRFYDLKSFQSSSRTLPPFYLVFPQVI